MSWPTALVLALLIIAMAEVLTFSLIAQAKREKTPPKPRTLPEWLAERDDEVARMQRDDERKGGSK